MSPAGIPLTRKLRSAARRAIKGPLDLNGHQYRGAFRGNVDGLSDEGVIRGWVIHRESKKGRVPVAIYAGDTLLDAGVADAIREDVRAATGGDAACGFQFGLTDALYQKIAAAGGKVSVRTEGAGAVELGKIELTPDASNPGLGADLVTRCRFALRTELAALLELAQETPAAAEPLPPVAQPALSRHATMFTKARLIPDIPESGQPAYLDYVRYRYRMDEHYAVEKGLENGDRFLYWYLTAYRGQEKRRTPLSAEQIDYLNAPLVMGGQNHALSRVIWWRLSARPDLMGKLNLNDRNAFLDVLFWWAHQDVMHLNLEDCLVPDRYADALRGVHPSRRLDAFPLSYFTERYFLDSPKLQFLDPGSAEGRKTLMLSLMLHAAKRPDLLRYVPRGQMSALLAPNPENPGGGSDFEAFVNGLLQAGAEAEAREADEDDGAEPATPATLALPRERYAAMLRRKFFDLDSYSFLTRDPAGHRYEAAALPVPDPGREEVDVQLIGPLAKASGLGQATRLSAAILRETELSVRGVDFDLDNPAPEGFSSETLIEDYGPAKINLIHLNAESTPLAYAYQPDVFSGAYNIGYFFWELDKPAYCHYLGMELLDEIWVSTEYGVEMYKPDAKGKPVVNVGMCYEEHPDITREAARAFVNRRFRFDESHYVCLVAFDSFSFVQRKNPVSVLKAFQKAFEGVPEARLVVKTQNRDSVFDPVQVNLWDRVDAIIAGDPRIVIMNETLSYRDLLQLKAGSDCYISLHKSEGWGFGMIEAMALKVPVICTAYSGNMDFCSEETAWLVDYEESELRPGDYIFVRPGSVWAEPSVEDAARQMRAAFDDPQARAAKAEAAYGYIRKNFSAPAIAGRYGGRLREILADLARES
ncbi:glycosyltransferase [Limimaricola pyoseonensis]|uniref:Glycosyltransferase involved in cell wall bisynthesis n=1 Tax=Limimaricola pyoseonensis TaxID=521013 RepID=A0A1G7KJN3_9RHOB|nr:glycosyltransferase [Limimaricola pyoseonensis]SDF37346.1 Glycosyltransferase involved in cell wall bisynthesis [Limimaricola pyoseonensis]